MTNIYIKSGIALLTMMCSMPAFSANPEWQQATGLYTGGNYSAALSVFRKLAEKSPRDASIHYMIGQCYKGLNKPQQASSEFDWVSKYAPDAQTRAMAKAMLVRFRRLRRLNPLLQVLLRRVQLPSRQNLRRMVL